MVRAMSMPMMKWMLLVSIFRRGLFEEYRIFGTQGPKIGHNLASFDQLHRERGLRWPVVNGKETKWRYREGSDPFVPAGKEVYFYGNKDGRANIIFAPYEPPAESPDADYNMWLATGRVIGTLAFRYHDTACARAVQGRAQCTGIYASR